MVTYCVSHNHLAGIDNRVEFKGGDGWINLLYSRQNLPPRKLVAQILSDITDHIEGVARSIVLPGKFVSASLKKSAVVLRSFREHSRGEVVPADAARPSGIGKDGI